jgi:plasmid stabilization system protein ParE
MSRIIRWTSESKRTFNQNLAYLSEDWGNSVINSFLDRVDSVLDQIRKNPAQFPLHNPSSDIRKCVVHKRIILYYKIVNETTIDLMTFWNTYQDPEKLKL